jgi:ribosomal protein S18 acetylase RimI-like enzyme
VPVEAAGVRLSELDTRRFGHVIARADEVGKDDLGGVVEFCEANGVELLIARCAVENLDAIHAMTRAGFLPMDTLVYYERDLAASPVADAPPARIDHLASGDAEQVEAIARASFVDYGGHYHADPRLDRVACTEVYASWARASCESEHEGDFALVAGSRHSRTAFSTFRRGPAGEGELLLGAVRPDARGTGLYRDLTIAGMLRYQGLGARRFITSTHLVNWAAQKTWTSAGMSPTRAYHTFHRWFDRG